LILTGILALGLLAPRTAEAECSHYVVVGSQPTFDQGGVELLLGIGKPPTRPERAPAEPPGRRVPCSGFLCSGNPAAPWVPGTPDKFRTEPWAVRERLVPITAPSGSLAPHHVRRFRPIRATGSVFRPPRLHAPFPAT